MDSKTRKQPPGPIYWMIIMAIGGGWLGIALTPQIFATKEIGMIVGAILGTTLGLVAGVLVRNKVKLSDGVISRLVLVTPQIILGAVLGAMIGNSIFHNDIVAAVMAILLAISAAGVFSTELSRN